MRVASLHVYPVKSTRPRDVSEAEVEPWGLAGDRRWMVIDDAGGHLTARQEPRLLTVSAVGGGDSRLVLRGPHTGPIVVEPDGRAAIPVRIWDDVVTAVRVGRAADAWFSALLDRDVRLVWLPNPASRPVDPAYGQAGDALSFADGYPLLLAATASLRQLNDWIAAAALGRGDLEPTPLPMRRFRPNVVVDTDLPFAEDTWRQLRIGTVSFRAVKPCSRCALTTINPDTLQTGPEPIRTLARHRKWDGKVWFAVNLIPDGTGIIRVGDDVEVLG